MKENKERMNLDLLPITDIKENSTYFSKESNIIKVLHLYPDKEEMYVLNISEQFHQMLSYDRHGLVKLIRN